MINQSWENDLYNIQIPVGRINSFRRQVMDSEAFLNTMENTLTKDADYRKCINDARLFVGGFA